jgi:iron complex outermembrane receptor protein
MSLSFFVLRRRALSAPSFSAPAGHRALGAAVLCVSSVCAAAQGVPATSSGGPVGSAAGQTLSDVTVTASPVGGAALAVPSDTLVGDGLTLRADTTLGQTLDGLPGISSSYFGPNASRPIIRGEDGDRIRVLNNGGAMIDASALSYDHAVPVDALSTERIEVLRGPAALLYGGSAVGGVVNVIDNRIPHDPIDGVNGKASADGATGNKERTGAAMVETGNGRFALHADVFDRRTSDVDVPRDLQCTKSGSPGLASRICNSASNTKGGALGGSIFFDRGYVGASVSGYRSDYGTVAEDNVTIGMRSNRYALESEVRVDAGPLQSLKLRASHTDYRHAEFDHGAPGTTFLNRGNDLRIEARQTPMGRLQGMIGLQAEATRFSAVGSEAFAPYSSSESAALFVNEALAMGRGKFIFGARAEKVSVESFGNDAIPRFESGKRDFHPHSAALGLVIDLTPEWQLTSNLAATQRAPKDYELFANGPHLATAAWETGDSQLQVEKSTGIDIGAQWKRGPHKFSLSAYETRFSNYIGLVRSGNYLTAEGAPRSAADPDGLPEYRYQGIRARFYGLEASGTMRLLGESGVIGSTASAGKTGSVLDLLLRGDLVRASNVDTGEPLPRIAPMRLGASLAYGNGPWKVQGGFDHSTSQVRVPDGDRAADAYTLWNAALSWRTAAHFGSTDSSLLWYARLDNITNQLAYSATSILTTTAFPKAPLPGRSLKVGVTATF